MRLLSVCRRWFWVSVVGLVGCNTTAPEIESPTTIDRDSTQEVCDGRDNDLDGEVDEGFRDARGVYFTVSHCGACGHACALDDRVAAVTCATDDRGARCVAAQCTPGYVVDEDGNCVSQMGWLCSACTANSECGRFDGAMCVWMGGEQRCSFSCEKDADCATGYTCSGEGVCEPKSGSCRCGPGDTFEMACSSVLEGGAVCPGVQRCEDGVLFECQITDEICDGLDNDCNGVVDDPYIGSAGTYNLDPRHCGGCGVDCTLGPQPEYEVTCGGPVTSPVCALLCPDSIDGVTAGDALDADLDPRNGCECTVFDTMDEPEALLGTDAVVDENCDGADGVVERSFFVAPWGSVGAAGSPIRPLSSLSEAVAAAAASLNTEHPRPDVYVAAGTYEEVLVLEHLEGVRILGGYRPDFLLRDTAAFPSVVSAPSYDAHGSVAGAALVVRSCGKVQDVVIEGLEFRGASATGPGMHAVGAFFVDVGSGLSLRNSVVRSGDAGSGERGVHGAAGTSASDAGGDGDLPRPAAEDASHRCTASPVNFAVGGRGAAFSCGGVSTSGGNGGSSSCPQGDGTTQQSGFSGAGVAPGRGGEGGTDCRGPIDYYNGCPEYLCCGLADFIVSDEYEVAQDGRAGGNGAAGTGGAGCSDGLGSMSATGAWMGSIGKAGTKGSAGSGGGGGGAGGGAHIDWYDYDCEFPDGLGGGGGGGGAGGCGGDGGLGGTSGAPSVGIVVVGASSPLIEGCSIYTGSGGRGGNGGNGGLPGKGSPGGRGGDLEPEQRITPTLAGPSSGGHGGQGGDGGGGGGGGGGCGGSVIGIWTVDVAAANAQVYSQKNAFFLGARGGAGAGGSGARNGKVGVEGRSEDVVAQ